MAKKKVFSKAVEIEKSLSEQFLASELNFNKVYSYSIFTFEK